MISSSRTARSCGDPTQSVALDCSQRHSEALGGSHHYARAKGPSETNIQGPSKQNIQKPSEKNIQGPSKEAMGGTHLVLPVLDHGRRPCLGRLEKRKEELIGNERLRRFDHHQREVWLGISRLGIARSRYRHQDQA